jgi:hypothetical protein
MAARCRSAARATPSNRRPILIGESIVFVVEIADMFVP